MQIQALEVYTGPTETAVEVRGLTTYRVVINEDEAEARIIAPGLTLQHELDPEFYPIDNPEVCAIMLVAQLEGGVKL